MAGASGGIKEIKSAAARGIIGRKNSSVTLAPPLEVPEEAPQAACFAWGTMTAPVKAAIISRRSSLRLPFSKGCCCPEVPTALRTVPPTYVRPPLTSPHHDVIPRSTSLQTSLPFIVPFHILLLKLQPLVLHGNEHRFVVLKIGPSRSPTVPSLPYGDDRTLTLIYRVEKKESEEKKRREKRDIASL